MIVDYSKFERGLNLHGDIAVPEGNSERIIETQLQPDNDGEIPDAEKETLELFLENYAQYRQLLLKPIFEYYQDCGNEWGDVEPDDELYPEVKDMNKMYEMVSLNGVIVYDEAYYGKRIMSLFYDCTWNEEEGMGIRIALGNNVSEVKVVKIGDIGYVY